MGKALQVRGTIQVVDLRTLNAEINEVCKVDIEEVDKRSVKELILSSNVTDKEISFTDEGIATAKFLLIKSDHPISVKFSSTLAPAIPTCYMIFMGEVDRLYINTTVSAKVRIIALDRAS